ncbi:serine/threonine-protein phosphatase 1 regulatory subunit 10 [Anaeramoeba flamelloides]|uniref:Serine/threonine-protein phosphatase 1 regulatory subunit 10 n=1 Tax=Anaeramoeba flamelloides TaxID=1746091 RepID=A0ABQ8ZDV0_9EUKA|nr:serine/threonine-protein phosphatase 1 regulatory subunit 10 [Anaeramoeba flamelloides]
MNKIVCIGLPKSSQTALTKKLKKKKFDVKVLKKAKQKECLCVICKKSFDKIKDLGTIYPNSKLIVYSRTSNKKEQEKIIKKIQSKCDKISFNPKEVVKYCLAKQNEKQKNETHKKKNKDKKQDKKDNKKKDKKKDTKKEKEKVKKKKKDEENPKSQAQKKDKKKKKKKIKYQFQPQKDQGKNKDQTKSSKTSTESESGKEEKGEKKNKKKKKKKKKYEEKTKSQAQKKDKIKSKHKDSTSENMEKENEKTNKKKKKNKKKNNENSKKKKKKKSPIVYWVTNKNYIDFIQHFSKFNIEIILDSKLENCFSRIKKNDSSIKMIILDMSTIRDKSILKKLDQIPINIVIIDYLEQNFRKQLEFSLRNLPVIKAKNLENIERLIHKYCNTKTPHDYDNLFTYDPNIFLTHKDKFVTVWYDVDRGKIEKFLLKIRERNICVQYFNNLQDTLTFVRKYMGKVSSIITSIYPIENNNFAEKINKINPKIDLFVFSLRASKSREITQQLKLKGATFIAPNDEGLITAIEILHNYLNFINCIPRSNGHLRLSFNNENLSLQKKKKNDNNIAKKLSTVKKSSPNSDVDTSKDLNKNKDHNSEVYSLSFSDTDPGISLMTSSHSSSSSSSGSSSSSNNKGESIPYSNKKQISLSSSSTSSNSNSNSDANSVSSSSSKSD